jgi:hypothetical protein
MAWSSVHETQIDQAIGASAAGLMPGVWAAR